MTSAAVALLPPSASVSIWSHPLVQPAPRAVPPGTLLRDTRPAMPDPLILRLNGEWLLQADWGGPVLPGDVVEWHVLVQGGNGSRNVLMLVAAVVIAFVQPELIAAYGAAGGAAAGIGLSIAASVLINALVPIKGVSDAANFQGTSPGSVYNTSTSGNQARLGQPIPVIYGRHLVFPDYASQPYTEYVDNDQYFHCTYCIGQGAYSAEWAGDVDEGQGR